MSKDNLENYKPIPNYSRYLISEGGDVWDTQRNKLVKQAFRVGMWRVQICKDGASKRDVAVHTLVYLAFVDNNPTLPLQLEHKDGDINNNHYANIVRRAKRSKEYGDSKYQELGVSTSLNLTIEELAQRSRSSIINRCYNANASSYSRYGAVGVKVCDEWHTQSNFTKWFKNNYIQGWHIDKDLVGDSTVYSPETCVFIPRSLNSVIAHMNDGNTVEKYKKGSFTLRTYIASKYVVFKGTSEEDCLEQLTLVRKLQMEKLLWLMEDYVSKIPNSPKIDPRVIQKIKEMID